MIDICSLVLSLAGLVVGFYFLIELHYFLRILLCVVGAKFFKKRKFILDKTLITGICLSTDIDYYLNHMNNARYLRELDFAKIDFYERTGLYRNIVAKGGSLFAGATTIRYRRFIRVFSRYQISTKIIYWDNQNIYIEHKFISSDKFINAIALCRLRLVKCDADIIMKELIQDVPKNVEVETTRRDKPELPSDLEKWIESNQISSDRLRQKDIIDEKEIEKV
ncbi:protein THEM6-like [Sitophilus oryzae]|uniref:Protein THEM6 n=1 Tax=Sitophilus oryzae TaxID=7048 RepID=A0A6J2YS33_SITOR|nr:protein THEM6-like [Sitophilus oryzae]XP_030766893.1 protein THEM6-like [Sitophilus oryzae]XP_030766894.1 protein THEM6-like [Sitophilus oryzae]